MEAARSPVIELYLSKGCCCGESYAQADDALLFTLSDSTCFNGYERVLRDANSVPLLHSVRTGFGFSKKTDVYKGDAGGGGSLVFMIKKDSSFFSRSYHVLLAGSALNGPPDYKLKDSTFNGTMKIFQQEQLVAKGFGFSKKTDVYKGDAGGGGSLVFTIKKDSSFFSRSYHVFLAGSALNGPPDYKLKDSTFSGTVKIFQQEQLVAKANQGCVFCGCFGPDYTISIFSGMDRAMVVLLIAIYDDLRPKSNGGASNGG